MARRRSRWALVISAIRAQGSALEPFDERSSAHRLKTAWKRPGARACRSRVDSDRGIAAKTLNLMVGATGLNLVKSRRANPVRLLAFSLTWLKYLGDRWRHRLTDCATERHTPPDVLTFC